MGPSGAGVGCRNLKGRLGLRGSGRGWMMMVVVLIVHNPEDPCMEYLPTLTPKVI